MTIKINGQNINAEVLPLVSETQDESLDVFSFALLVNNIAEPFAPFQSVELAINELEKLK